MESVLFKHRKGPLGTGSEQNGDVSQRAGLAPSFEYVCAGPIPYRALNDFKQASQRRGC